MSDTTPLRPEELAGMHREADTWDGFDDADRMTYGTMYADEFRNYTVDLLTELDRLTAERDRLRDGIDRIAGRALTESRAPFVSGGAGPTLDLARALKGGLAESRSVRGGYDDVCPGPASPQTFHRYAPHPDCPECGPDAPHDQEQDDE